MIPAYLGFVVSPAHQEKCWWPRDSGTAKSAIRDVPAQRRPIGARKRLKLPGAIMHPCEALETAKEMPLAEAVKIRNIKNVIVGGGGSHQRTRLCASISLFWGKIQGNSPDFSLKKTMIRRVPGVKFNGLSANFPKRQNRENFPAISELKLNSRENTLRLRQHQHLQGILRIGKSLQTPFVTPARAMCLVFSLPTFEN